MKSHLLCYHDDKEKAIMCQSGYEIGEKTGEIKWTGKFRIPDSEWGNRLLFDAKGNISCRKIGDELDCTLHGPTGFLPEICYRDEQGKLYCGYNFIRENPDEFITAVMDLAKFEKIRPDLVQWLRDENVRFIYDGRTQFLGWADCHNDWYKRIAISPKSFHPVETIAHEVAHCKEQITRKRKGLPPMYAKWEREDKNLIPIGGEKRAVHFEERISKKLRQRD